MYFKAYLPFLYIIVFILVITNHWYQIGMLFLFFQLLGSWMSFRIPISFVTIFLASLQIFGLISDLNCSFSNKNNSHKGNSSSVWIESTMSGKIWKYEASIKCPPIAQMATMAPFKLQWRCWNNLLVDWGYFSRELSSSGLFSYCVTFKLKAPVTTLTPIWFNKGLFIFRRWF